MFKLTHHSQHSLHACSILCESFPFVLPTHESSGIDSADSCHSLIMPVRDFISGEAELADESDDESFDEESGEIRKKSKARNGTNGHPDDSSEEETDEDEEAMRKVSRGKRCWVAKKMF